MLVVGADALGELHREAAAEDAEPAEDRALRLLEQAMAPFHRRAQRLVAAQRGARSGREQAEAFAQAAVHGAQAEQRHPCRRELDCQRQPVELAADVDRERQVGIGELEARRRGAHARLEEKQCAVTARIRNLRVVRHVERLDTDLLLGLHPQRFLARGQHAQPGSGFEQPFDQHGERLEQMLAVVDDEQHLAAGKRIDERL